VNEEVSAEKNNDLHLGGFDAEHIQGSSPRELVSVYEQSLVGEKITGDNLTP